MTTHYTEEQALTASIDYFNGNEKAAKIWLSKYCLKDNDGNLHELTPDDMFWRIAGEIARIEENKFEKPLSEKEVYDYIKDFERIIFQGSPMFGIGNPFQVVSLSNCFVVDSVHDSYAGILRNDEYIAQISKRRGGIGYDISNLRPKNMSVNNAARTTTGAASFMHRFSNTGREVGQGGRRAAQMITIYVHHPDVEDFITIKDNENSVTGANISVRISDEFMIAVHENITYKQWWGSKDNAKEVFAKPIWNKIVESAWKRAEPGVLFWDNILKECPAEPYKEFGFGTVSTNPCGEITLSPYDSCRLLALNIFSYVENPYTSNAWFNFDKFYKDAKIAQRFMDDLIDLELECIDKIINKVQLDNPEFNQVELTLWKRIRKACEQGRRTGTGVTAIGDTIAGLNLKYGSDDSINIIEDIYKTLKHACYESSIEMAEELGAFPVWNHELEKDCPFLLRINDERPDLWERMKKSGRRNIALLTTAPTGTISQLTKMGPYFETTSGIEPLFTWKPYIRRKKVNHNEKNAPVDFIDKLGDKWTNFEVRHSGIQYFLDVNPGKTIEDSPYYGASANEIDWLQRVRLQAKATKHICHSISSTLNLPEDISKEKVSEIYLTAWKLGCKGITIYRDGCRSGVLVTKTEENKQTINKTDAPKRPKDLEADIHTFKIAGKDYTAFVGLLEKEPYEILVKTDTDISRNVKVGTVRKIRRGHYSAIVEGEVIVDSITEGMSHEEEALTRMVSTALRHGADIHYIVHQLEKTKGDMISFAKCLSRALKKYIKDGSKVSGETCNRCESNGLVRQEGCITCQNCGWSKCG